MSFWLINHSWESFRRTQEYCGFQSETERNNIKIGDKLTYFGNGLVFGLFEVIALPENEFKGWQKPYVYQVKLNPILIAKGGLTAKPLESKILMKKSEGGSPNLVELTENEFKQIKQAIETEQKQLIFK